MAQSEQNHQLAFFISSISFGILGLFNSYYSYCFFHYRRLPEQSLVQLLNSETKKPTGECLVTGTTACSNPLTVLPTQSRFLGDAFQPIIYSKSTIQLKSQSNRILGSSVETNYRNFHIEDQSLSLDITVTPNSEFLAKTIYDKTEYKPVSFWGGVARVLVDVVNVFIVGEISYEAATRKVEEVFPVGVSACVAGWYVASASKPTFAANIVAFNKQSILSNYKWPFIILSICQLISGGIAVYTYTHLQKLQRQKDAQQRVYEGQSVQAGRECKICLTNPCDVIFQPCQHMCCCKICAQQVATCPMCRANVEARTEVFIS